MAPDVVLVEPDREEGNRGDEHRNGGAFGDALADGLP
jgi:hypothetical protein